jgi:hypothetical protein
MKLMFVFLICFMLAFAGCAATVTSTTKDLGSGGNEVTAMTKDDPDATLNYLVKKANSAADWLWATVTKLRTQGADAEKIATIVAAATAIPDYVNTHNFAAVDNAFNNAWNLACTLAGK